MYSLREDLAALIKAISWYSRKKIITLAKKFEGFKNLTVVVLMYRRGILQKNLWHGSMVTLTSVGLLTSGVFGGQSIISASYPGIGGPDPRFVSAFEPFPNGVILEDFQDPETQISQKPRSEIIKYKVEDGDSLSSIGKKFGISSDTIKWANDLSDVDAIKPGQTLKILPLTGVAHTVKSADSLESVGKIYSAEPQAIVDYPFNDVPDDFRLRVGQVLIVPDGVPPEVKAPAKPRPQPKYLAEGPSSPAFEAPGGGKFVWPAGGSISQYFAWYHPGIDIPNKVAPGIAASDGGEVILAGWPDRQGYGNRIVIDHGNGYRSLYAHLSNIYISVGERVSRGQIIGQMGSTGRSTGIHLHFEIHFKGVPINPLAILK